MFFEDIADIMKEKLNDSGSLTHSCTFCREFNLWYVDATHSLRCEPETSRLDLCDIGRGPNRAPKSSTLITLQLRSKADVWFRFQGQGVCVG